MFEASVNTFAHALYRSCFKGIERFHSRDQQPYWITETKESLCIKIEFNLLFSKCQYSA